MKVSFCKIREHCHTDMFNRAIKKINNLHQFTSNSTVILWYKFYHHSFTVSTYQTSEIRDTSSPLAAVGPLLLGGFLANRNHSRHKDQVKTKTQSSSSSSSSRHDSLTSYHGSALNMQLISSIIHLFTRQYGGEHVGPAGTRARRRGVSSNLYWPLKSIWSRRSSINCLTNYSLQLSMSLCCRLPSVTGSHRGLLSVHHYLHYT